VAAETITALKTAMAVLGYNPAEMGPALMMAAEAHLSERPSVLGKLLFLAERACSPAVAAPLRAKLPYGAEYVDSLQQMLLEKTFRAAVLDSNDDLLAATIPEEAEVLGLSDADAQALLDGIQKEEADARAKAAAESDEVDTAEQARAELLKRVEAEAPPESFDSPAGGSAGDATPSGSASKAGGSKTLECTKCGYMLFPAAGREFKFFGDDFKCPQCGSGKDAFKDVTDED
jgi:rubredoxin